MVDNDKDNQDNILKCDHNIIYNYINILDA